MAKMSVMAREECNGHRCNKRADKEYTWKAGAHNLRIARVLLLFRAFSSYFRPRVPRYNVSKEAVRPEGLSVAVVSASVSSGLLCPNEK